MDEKRIVDQVADFGRAYITLKDALEKRGVSRNRLSVLTGLDYALINRYYNNEISSPDLEKLARICYVLDCQMGDLVRYIPPQEQ